MLSRPALTLHRFGSISPISGAACSLDLPKFGPNTGLAHSYF